MSTRCTRYACRCARGAELAGIGDRTGDVWFLLEAMNLHLEEVECREPPREPNEKLVSQDR